MADAGSSSGDGVFDGARSGACCPFSATFLLLLLPLFGVPRSGGGDGEAACSGGDDSADA